MAQLHVTLLAAALAALINLWLMVRCGQARNAAKVAHGDGGDATLSRHMRAHSNFTEFTPIALVLILVLELSGQAGWLLAASALVFMAGRVVHAFGMQADTPGKPRMIGIMATMITYLVWIIWAGLAAFQIV